MTCLMFFSLCLKLLFKDARIASYWRFMFKSKNKKKVYPCTPQFCHVKVGFELNGRVILIVGLPFRNKRLIFTIDGKIG